jgi:exosome complex RNA-binding protein Rrp4
MKNNFKDLTSWAKQLLKDLDPKAELDIIQVQKGIDIFYILGKNGHIHVPYRLLDASNSEILKTIRLEREKHMKAFEASVRARVKAKEKQERQQLAKLKKKYENT